MNIDIDLILQDHEPGHDHFQVDKFIIGKKGHTRYGQYRQAVREFVARTRNLLRMYIDTELAELDLADLQRLPLDEPGHSTSDRRRELEMARLTIEARVKRSSLRQMEDEWTRFLGWSIALKSEIGEVTEDMKREYWIVRLTIDSILRMKSGQAPAWSSIYAMGPKARARVTNVLKDPVRAEQFLDGNDLPELEFEVPRMSHHQIKEIVNASYHSKSSILVAQPNDSSSGELLEA